jgi:cell division protein FtsQ
MIRGMLGVLLLAGLAAGGAALWQRLDQPVRSIRVEGSLSSAEQEAVQAVLAASIAGGVLSLGLEALTSRIHELSWPREVRIRRVWPDGLVVQVERETAVAAWGDAEFLTGAGKVVRFPEPERRAGLPVLAASLSTPRNAMQTYLFLQEQLSESGLRIGRLEENRIGEWTVTLDNGVTVALGNEALSERVRRFLAIYRHARAERGAELAHVDARYRNGVAVRWSEALLALDGTGEQVGRDTGFRNGL